MTGHMHGSALKGPSQRASMGRDPSSSCASTEEGLLVTFLPCAPSSLVCILDAALYKACWSLTVRLVDPCLSAQLPFLPSARWGRAWRVCKFLQSLQGPSLAR